MEVTIEITQYCPYGDCDYCSSNASPEGKHLPKETIFNFLNTLKKPIDLINISGGEPLFHPNIGEIIWFCRSKAKKVRVYTNMIESIIYNADKVKDIEVEANVCIVAGRNTYIPEPFIKVKTHLLKLIHHGRASSLPDQDIVVSSNFYNGKCENCDHLLLQADGKIVRGPCKKNYATPHKEASP